MVDLINSDGFVCCQNPRRDVALLRLYNRSKLMGQRFDYYGSFVHRQNPRRDVALLRLYNLLVLIGLGLP